MYLHIYQYVRSCEEFGSFPFPKLPSVFSARLSAWKPILYPPLAACGGTGYIAEPRNRIESNRSFAAGVPTLLVLCRFGCCRWPLRPRSWPPSSPRRLPTCSSFRRGLPRLSETLPGGLCTDCREDATILQRDDGKTPCTFTISKCCNPKTQV